MASDEKTLIDLIKQVNKLKKKTKSDWFICEECEELFLTYDFLEYLPTSKWGYERSFCRWCVQRCKYCGQYYAPSMEYKHEDCKSSSSSESEEDDESASEESDNMSAGSKALHQCMVDLWAEREAKKQRSD